jgi:L,D-transpeptidase YcbB
MNIGDRNWRGALLSMCVLFAAQVAGATAADAQTPSVEAALAQSLAPFSVAPEAPPILGKIEGGPLLDVLIRSQAPPLSPDLGAFARLAPAVVVPWSVGADSAEQGAAAAVEATPPPPIPTRTASPAPAPVSTAIAAATVRLIVGNSVNPLGDGDWRAARAAIGAFYAARGFEPVWVSANGLTSAGRAALVRLERAAEDGLSLSGFIPPKRVAAGLKPDELAEAEIAIAVAVVAYAEQASGSRVAPSRISPLISAAPSVADPGVALAETAAAADPGARLAEFNPPQKGYRELREELRRLTGATPDSRRPAALDLGVDLAESALVGDDAVLGQDSQFDAPRPKKASRRSRAYTASADAALRRARNRRRAAILANMEMWRWEPRDMGARRIEVNIPDFSVEVFEGDTLIHSARVVVGKPQTPTPVFSNVMRYVLINPAWQVPDSIIRKEILPRLDHFERRGYQVRTIGGRITVRQPPGDDNALGRLAFMFPNEHSVYLHDTPARELFSEDMRALSHGCIRVEDPLRLAELVLGWPESRLDAAIGGPERTVFLPQPLPIHIEYFTDFVDEDGILQERPDVYGLTQKVAGTLSATSQD